MTVGSTLSPADLKGLSLASDLDLAMFREAHIEARVRRALDGARLAGVAELREAMRDDAVRSSFRQSVAISVTGFFRDADQFDLLDRHIGWLRQTPRPRIWSAGCSNGAELWSMAVLLDRLGAVERAELLGSDLLAENIVRARRGLDEGLLGGHVLPPEAAPRFEVRDLVAEPAPAGLWHVILCRNVAIYLERAAQTALHTKLANGLAPGGMLLLGRSERIPEPKRLGLEYVAPHLYRRTA